MCDSMVFTCYKQGVFSWQEVTITILIILTIQFEFPENNHTLPLTSSQDVVDFLLDLKQQVSKPLATK